MAEKILYYGFIYFWISVAFAQLLDVFGYLTVRTVGIQKQIEDLLEKHYAYRKKLAPDWKEVRFSVNPNFVIFGKPIQVVAFVRSDYHRSFINTLFLLNIKAYWFSWLFPILLLKTVVMYHHNIFKSQ